MEQKDKKKEVPLSERMHPVVILPALLIVMLLDKRNLHCGEQETSELNLPSPNIFFFWMMIQELNQIGL